MSESTPFKADFTAYEDLDEPNSSEPGRPEREVEHDGTFQHQRRPRDICLLISILGNIVVSLALSALLFSSIKSSGRSSSTANQVGEKPTVTEGTGILSPLGTNI